MQMQQYCSNTILQIYCTIIIMQSYTTHLVLLFLGVTHVPKKWTNWRGALLSCSYLGICALQVLILGFILEPLPLTIFLFVLNNFASQ